MSFYVLLPLMMRFNAHTRKAMSPTPLVPFFTFLSWSWAVGPIEDMEALISCMDMDAKNMDAKNMAREDMDAKNKHS